MQFFCKICDQHDAAKGVQTCAVEVFVYAEICMSQCSCAGIIDLLLEIIFRFVQNGLLLFLDGARLGSAFTAPENDLTLPDLAALTDLFYIGGTKNGALMGEALVVNTPNDHFRWHMKQRGAILAKGRLLGVQFKALLENGLYFDIARHANEMAYRLRDGMAALGYEFPVASPTNQQFPVLPNTVLQQLQDKGYAYELDHVVDDEHTCVRFCTSWATPVEAVDQLLKDLAACK